MCPPCPACSTTWQTRFGVGRVCVVADRGLISADNVEILDGHGFAHVLATRLHRDPTCTAALDAATAEDAVWVASPRQQRHRLRRRRRRAALCRGVLPRTPGRATRCAPPNWWPAPKPSSSALEWRVRDGLLTDAGKIGRAAQRILGPSGVGRLFDVEIGPGRFLYHYNDAAFAYEEPLAGHYVLTTSLTGRGVHRPVVTAYQQLQKSTPLPGPQRLPPSPTRAALDRDPCPRAHRHLRLRLHHRSPHHPRPPRRRRPRPRPRRPAPQLRSGATRARTGSGPSPSTPAGAPSTSSPAAPPSKPASCAPCTSTPPLGPGPHHLTGLPLTSRDSWPAPTPPTRHRVVTTRRNTPRSTRTFTPTPPNSGPEDLPTGGGR